MSRLSNAACAARISLSNAEACDVKCEAAGDKSSITGARATLGVDFIGGAVVNRLVESILACAVSVDARQILLSINECASSAA